jgi:serine/threonine protein kinase
MQFRVRIHRVRTAFNILEKNEGKFMSEKTVIKILMIVANVLEYMHKKGIAHRDIKMENILVNSEG